MTYRPKSPIGRTQMSGIPWTDDNQYMYTLFACVYKFKAHLTQPDTPREYTDVWGVVKRSLCLHPLYDPYIVSVKMCQVIYIRYISQYKQAYLEGHTLRLSSLEKIARKIILESCPGIVEERQQCIESMPKMYPAGDLQDTPQEPPSERQQETITDFLEPLPSQQSFSGILDETLDELLNELSDPLDPPPPPPRKPQKHSPPQVPGQQQSNTTQVIIIEDDTPPPSPKRQRLPATLDESVELAQIRLELEQLEQKNRRMNIVESLLHNMIDMLN